MRAVFRGRNLAKLLAMLFMTVDHIGLIMGLELLRVIGRAAFPIFAYLMADGWNKTHDKDKYFNRVAGCAVLSQLPYLWLTGRTEMGSQADVGGVFLLFAAAVFVLWALSMISGTYSVLWLFALLYVCVFGVFMKCWPNEVSLNVMYTFGAAMLFVRIKDVEQESGRDLSRWIYAAAVMGMMAGFLLKCDYSVFGIGFVVALMFFENDYAKLAVSAVWCLAIYQFAYGNNWYCLWSMIGVVICWLLCRQESEKPPKWFCSLGYWYYPAHMAVLAGIAVFIENYKVQLLG